MKKLMMMVTAACVCLLGLPGAQAAPKIKAKIGKKSCVKRQKDKCRSKKSSGLSACFKNADRCRLRVRQSPKKRKGCDAGCNRVRSACLSRARTQAKQQECNSNYSKCMLSCTRKYPYTSALEVSQGITACNNKYKKCKGATLRRFATCLLRAPKKCKRPKAPRKR